MKPKHMNTGTFVGRVEDMSTLQKDPLGRPLLPCNFLDCRPRAIENSSEGAERL